MEESVNNFKKEHKNNNLAIYLLVALISLTLGLIGGFIGSYFAPTIKDIVEIGTKEIAVQESSATIEVAQKVSPSVVSITAEQSTMDFFGRIQQSESSGTGFIVSEDGLIVTNKHVVSSQGADYSVFTHDGQEYKAKVVATDPYFDIALIKIDASDLVVAELGDSDDLKTGQTAIAIGNALGQFDNTVTKGVISAVSRSITAASSPGRTQDVLENMIQTDAAINPGNSGGPLVNIDGQVIGINTAIAGGAEGIGFAIPINVAKTAITSYRANNQILRPMIGIRYINITKDFATRNNLDIEHGALIYSPGSDLAIVPGTPAAQAGLKEGDIITKIDDHEIRAGQSLITVLYKYQPGDEVNITFIRDGSEKSVKLVLSEGS